MLRPKWVVVLLKSCNAASIQLNILRHGEAPLLITRKYLVVLDGRRTLTVPCLRRVLLYRLAAADLL